EARRAGVQQSEAIPPRLHLEEGLDLAVHQELVAQDAVQAEEVEGQLAVRRVVDLVREHQRNVELRIAGKAEAGRLVAGVELVEHEIEAYQPLVGVLRRE